MEKIIDDYIQKNRGYVTASKLKCFMKSPEDFFLKYIKEVEPLRNKEKKCFSLGNAIDYYISYGKDKFFQKYWIDEGLKKAELELKLSDMGVQTSGLKVDDLKALLYGDISEKIRLTAGDGETVLGCVNELIRQDMFNADGGYECQKEYIGKYKSLKLKGTLDRDKTGEIRDTKSTKSINSFVWEWNKELGYDVSMCFYWVLKNISTGDESRLIFDVVQKTFPFPSRIFEIPQGNIIEVVKNTIKPALDTLDAMMVAYEETGDESIWKVKRNLDTLANCEMYPVMETAIQKEIEYLQ